MATAPSELIKPVTILFADVVGSTAQLENMPPEDARALMAEFFEAMSEEIVSEGGTVERLIGDAIMADFGVPITREDDPVRAVRAAKRMLERLKKFNSERPEDHHLQIRIGINTGEVSTGGTLGEQLMVMGDAVNVAARLQQTAQPGTIVIGDRTARAVRDRFRLDEVTDLRLKGKTDQVSAYLVGSDLAPDSVKPEHATPLVGRTVEMQLLRTTFERVRRDATPFVALIVGDPGVGKSRLTAEFVDSLRAEAKVVAGRCFEYGEGVALAPLREILRAEAGLLAEDSPDTAMAKLTRLAESLSSELLAESGFDRTRAISALASTLGLEVPTDATGMDPREVRREIVMAWRVLVSSLAARGPLIVVIEDLYAAGDTVLEVLEDLSQYARGPILFLCVTRPELMITRSEWIGSLKNYTSLSLPPLAEDEAAALVDSVLDVEQFPSGVRERILAKAEGNPFFIEEILQRLIDQGHATRSNGRWKVVHDLSDLVIPDTVQAVILSRLDLLPSEQRPVIQNAAVVGRRFWTGAIESMTGLHDVDTILKSLKRRELVTEGLTSSLEGEIEHSFKHVLIRDVAYESLPRRDRGQAHSMVAQWIEGLKTGGATDLAEILAHHYDRAFDLLDQDDLRTKARIYCLEAARSAGRRFAPREAERFAHRAVELSRGAPERFESLEALADTLSLGSRGDSAWAAYNEALEEIRAEHDFPAEMTARVCAKAAVIPTRHMAMMDVAPEAEAIDRVIQLGLDSASEEDSWTRASLLCSRVFMHAWEYRRPDEGARKVADEALRIAERLEDPDLLSAALDASSGLLDQEGRCGEILEVARRRIRLVPRLRSLSEICDVYATAASFATFTGRFPEAIRHTTGAVEAARGLDLSNYIFNLMYRVQAKFMIGEWDDALSDLAEIESLDLDESGEPRSTYATRAYGVGFFCHELRGDSASADRYLSIVRRFREATAEHPRVLAIGPLSIPARGLAHRGDFEEARSWLHLGRTIYRGAHLEAACEVVGAQEDWHSAPEIVAKARQEADHGDLLTLSLFADRLEGRVAAATGRFEDAQNLLTRSAEGFASLGCPWEQAWSTLLLAETLSAAGLTIEAENTARAALSTFEGLQSVQEIDRCRKLFRAAE